MQAWRNPAAATVLGTVFPKGKCQFKSDRLYNEQRARW